MKRCTKCSVEKDLEDFVIRQSKPKRIYSSHCKECHRARSKKYYRDNKDKCQQYHAEYRSKNREVIRERKRQFYRNNKDKYRYYKHVRRARLKEGLCECCTRRDFLNFYARCPEGMDVDHIQALAAGGKHCVKNLQYLDPYLNLLKRTDNIIYL